MNRFYVVHEKSKLIENPTTELSPSRIPAYQKKMQTPDVNIDIHNIVKLPPIKKHFKERFAPIRKEPNIIYSKSIKEYGLYINGSESNLQRPRNKAGSFSVSPSKKSKNRIIFPKYIKNKQREDVSSELLKGLSIIKAKIPSAFQLNNPLNAILGKKDACVSTRNNDHSYMCPRHSYPADLKLEIVGELIKDELLMPWSRGSMKSIEGN